MCREVAVHAERQGRGGVLPPGMRQILAGKDTLSNKGLRVGTVFRGTPGGALTEQELYAGADSMEIVRDAHAYFSNKQMEWQSANDAIRDLDSVHRTGVEAMGLLVVGLNWCWCSSSTKSVGRNNDDWKTWGDCCNSRWYEAKGHDRGRTCRGDGQCHS